MSHTTIGVEGGAYEKRIQVSDYKGKTNIDLRSFFRKDDGSYGHTKKGITFRPDQIDEVCEALQKAKKEALEDNSEPKEPEPEP